MSRERCIVPGISRTTPPVRLDSGRRTGSDGVDRTDLGRHPKDQDRCDYLKDEGGREALAVTAPTDRLSVLDARVGHVVGPLRPHAVGGVRTAHVQEDLPCGPEEDVWEGPPPATPVVGQIGVQGRGHGLAGSVRRRVVREVATEQGVVAPGVVLVEVVGETVLLRVLVDGTVTRRAQVVERHLVTTDLAGTDTFHKVYPERLMSRTRPCPFPPPHPHGPSYTRLPPLSVHGSVDFPLLPFLPSRLNPKSYSILTS